MQTIPLYRLNVVTQWLHWKIFLDFSERSNETKINWIEKS